MHDDNRPLPIARWVSLTLDALAARGVPSVQAVAICSYLSRLDFDAVPLPTDIHPADAGAVVGVAWEHRDEAIIFEFRFDPADVPLGGVSFRVLRFSLTDQGGGPCSPYHEGEPGRLFARLDEGRVALKRLWGRRLESPEVSSYEWHDFEKGGVNDAGPEVVEKFRR